MSTRASLAFGENIVGIADDGYPENVIPQILGVMNGDFAAGMKSIDLPLCKISETPSDYGYIVSDDLKELKVISYHSSTVINLEQLFNMYSQSEEAFGMFLAEVDDYIGIPNVELQMTTDEYIESIGGNAFDYAFHMMAKDMIISTDIKQRLVVDL